MSTTPERVDYRATIVLVACIAAAVVGFLTGHDGIGWCFGLLLFVVRD